jgi:hypothetical protein
VGLTPSCDTINSFYISNADNVQELPDVTYGSGNYVAVWVDLRNSVDRHIFAARITPQWAVLDTGNVVASNSTYQITPVIAFDGNRFLVVWQSLAAPFGIHGRFLNDQAQPVDTVLTISSGVSAVNPRIVFSDSKYLIVWQEYTTTNQIFGQFVSPDGSLLGSHFQITSGTANHVTPGVCYDGNSYLVVWSQTRIWGQFLTGAGMPIGVAFPVSLAVNDQADPDVFFGGNRFLTVWSDFQNDYDIYGNLDAQIGVVESSYDPVVSGSIHPDKTIFTDHVTLLGLPGMEFTVFNVLGEHVEVVRNGTWHAHGHPSGIYFLSWGPGNACSVVKVR